MPEKTDHDRLVEIHTVLLGANGSPGLVKLVERNTKAISKLWIVIAVIATSMGGGFGLLQLFR